MKVLQTFDGVEFDLSDEQAARVIDMSSQPDVRGVDIKGQYIAFASIKGIFDVPDRGVSWEEIKVLPGQGYAGVIEVATRSGKLEAFKRGLMRSIEHMEVDGYKAAKARELLALAETRSR